MAVNWNDYLGAGREQWAGLLRDLLIDARAAIEADDDKRRQAVYDDLDSFIRRSPNSFSRQLDQAARATLDEIFAAATKDLIQGLASRTAELSVYVKEVRAIAEEANASAELLSLRFARDAISRTTETIASLKGLRDSIGGNDDAKKLGEEIDRAIKSIQKVRGAIESASPDATSNDSA